MSPRCQGPTALLPAPQTGWEQHPWDPDRPFGTALGEAAHLRGISLHGPSQCPPHTLGCGRPMQDPALASANIMSRETPIRGSPQLQQQEMTKQLPEQGLGPRCVVPKGQPHCSSSSCSFLPPKRHVVSAAFCLLFHGRRPGLTRVAFACAAWKPRRGRECHSISSIKPSQTSALAVRRAGCIRNCREWGDQRDQGRLPTHSLPTLPTPADPCPTMLPSAGIDPQNP